MEQTLYLVRHAESTMKGKYCGFTDAPLSATGYRQAKKIAKFFSGIPVQICYVSDLKRARQTLLYFTFSRQVISLQTSQLREINFGKWEKRSYAFVAKQWPEIYSQWMKSPANVKIPLGESFSDFFTRIKSFSKNITAATKSNIVVVAHGGSLAALIMVLLKRPLKEFWQWIPKTASISILKRALNGKASSFQIERMNDLSHLI